MRAIVYPGAGEVLLADRPAPVPSATGLLVRVAAAGLNRADLLQRAGRYPAPAGWPADIPGLEYAGTVEAVGPAVRRWKVGDRVMGLVGGGAHAEFVAVDQREALAVPEAIPLTEAAAIPEAFLTAWDALVPRGRVIAGERVLIHAVGSGVGTAAAQLARWLGAVVLGTSRSPDKLVRAEAFGMQHGILTTDPAWPEAVGGPVDLVLDTLGAAVFAQSLDLLAVRGRLVALGTLTGTDVTLDLRRVLSRRLEVIGSVMRTRSLAERGALVEQFGRDVLPAFASDALRPVVDLLMPMSDIEEAHRMMQANETFGKVVLAW